MHHHHIAGAFGIAFIVYIVATYQLDTSSKRYLETEKTFSKAIKISGLKDLSTLPKVLDSDSKKVRAAKEAVIAYMQNADKHLEKTTSTYISKETLAKAKKALE